MALSPDATYARLGYLISTMPDLILVDHNSPEVLTWLSASFALVKTLGGDDAAKEFRSSQRRLDNAYTQKDGAQTIVALLYRHHALAELKVPASSQGSFIPAGNSFDAIGAISKVMQQGSQDILIVDPYMDDKVLTDYALFVPMGTPIRLLVDSASIKQTLSPQVRAWIAQYGQDRPLEARLTLPRVLHDRLIIVDNTTVWILSQSFNSFATRSPATIVRTSDDIAASKVAAYGDLWRSGKVLG